MGFLDLFKPENNDNQLEQRSYNRDSSSFKAIFSSEATITVDDILEIPTAQACLEIISSTIAQLPIYLYKEDDDGEISRMHDDYREKFLNEETNEFETAFNFKKHAVQQYLLHGVTYAYVEKSANEIVAVHRLEADKMQLEKKYKRGFILSDVDYSYNGEGGQAEFKEHELLKVLRDTKDGVKGYGILESGKKLINTIKGESTYLENIYKNGALPMGILSTDGRLSDGTLKSIKESWQNIYTGVHNAGKTLLLEEGLKYQPLSLNPNDLQLKDNKKDHRSEVCKLFNLPESLVNSQANKYASIEQNNIHFLQYSISPILKAFESAIDRIMLLEDEKEDGYFFKFDEAQVLRMTQKEKYETIKLGLDAGIISMNEGRYELNMKSLKDDFMKWSLGNILYDKEKSTLMIPNMGTVMSTDGKLIVNSKDGMMANPNMNSNPAPEDKELSEDTELTKTKEDGELDNE